MQSDIWGSACQPKTPEREADCDIMENYFEHFRVTSAGDFDSAPLRRVGKLNLYQLRIWGIKFNFALLRL